MSAQHIAGPWLVLHHSRSDTSIVASGFDHAICRLDINHATEESQEADEAQMEANARLIAASPLMLIELESAARRLDWFLDMNPDHADSTLNVIRQDIRAVIALATGATP